MIGFKWLKDYFCGRPVTDEYAIERLLILPTLAEVKLNPTIDKWTLVEVVFTGNKYVILRNAETGKEYSRRIHNLDIKRLN